MLTSTPPNKAFWEAVTLVGILLAILLMSVLHLKGWLPGGSSEPERESDRNRSDRSQPQTPATAGAPGRETPQTPPTADSDRSQDSPRSPRDRPDRPRGGGRGDGDGGGGGGPGGGLGQAINEGNSNMRANVHLNPNLDLHLNYPPNGKHYRTIVEPAPDGSRNRAPGEGYTEQDRPVSRPVTPAPPRGETGGVPGQILDRVPQSALPRRGQFEYSPWETGQGETVGEGERPSVSSIRPEDFAAPLPPGVNVPKSALIVNPMWLPDGSFIPPEQLKSPARSIHTGEELAARNVAEQETPEGIPVGGVKSPSTIKPETAESKEAKELRKEAENAKEKEKVKNTTKAKEAEGLRHILDAAQKNAEKLQQELEERRKVKRKEKEKRKAVVPEKPRSAEEITAGEEVKALKKKLEETLAEAEKVRVKLEEVEVEEEEVLKAREKEKGKEKGKEKTKDGEKGKEKDKAKSKEKRKERNRLSGEAGEPEKAKNKNKKKTKVNADGEEVSDEESEYELKEVLVKDKDGKERVALIRQKKAKKKKKKNKAASSAGEEEESEIDVETGKKKLKTKKKNKATDEEKATSKARDDVTADLEDRLASLEAGEGGDKPTAKAKANKKKAKGGQSDVSESEEEEVDGKDPDKAKSTKKKKKAKVGEDGEVDVSDSGEEATGLKSKKKKKRVRKANGEVEEVTDSGEDVEPSSRRTRRRVEREADDERGASRGQTRRAEYDDQVDDGPTGRLRNVAPERARGTVQPRSRGQQEEYDDGFDDYLAGTQPQGPGPSGRAQGIRPMPPVRRANEADAAWRQRWRQYQVEEAQYAAGDPSGSYGDVAASGGRQFGANGPTGNAHEGSDLGGNAKNHLKDMFGKHGKDGKGRAAGGDGEDGEDFDEEQDEDAGLTEKQRRNKAEAKRLLAAGEVDMNGEDAEHEQTEGTDGAPAKEKGGKKKNKGNAETDGEGGAPAQSGNADGVSQPMSEREAADHERGWGFNRDAESKQKLQADVEAMLRHDREKQLQLAAEPEDVGYDPRAGYEESLFGEDDTYYSDRDEYDQRTLSPRSYKERSASVDSLESILNPAAQGDQAKPDNGQVPGPSNSLAPPAGEQFAAATDAGRPGEASYNAPGAPNERSRLDGQSSDPPRNAEQQGVDGGSAETGLASKPDVTSKPGEGIQDRPRASVDGPAARPAGTERGEETSAVDRPSLGRNEAAAPAGFTRPADERDNTQDRDQNPALRPWERDLDGEVARPAGSELVRTGDRRSRADSFDSWNYADHSYYQDENFGRERDSGEYESSREYAGREGQRRLEDAAQARITEQGECESQQGMQITLGRDAAQRGTNDRSPTSEQQLVSNRDQTLRVDDAFVARDARLGATENPKPISRLDLDDGSKPRSRLQLTSGSDDGAGRPISVDLAVPITPNSRVREIEDTAAEEAADKERWQRDRDLQRADRERQRAADGQNTFPPGDLAANSRPERHALPAPRSPNDRAASDREQGLASPEGNSQGASRTRQRSLERERVRQNSEPASPLSDHGDFMAARLGKQYMTTEGREQYEREEEAERERLKQEAGQDFVAEMDPVIAAARRELKTPLNARDRRSAQAGMRIAEERRRAAGLDAGTDGKEQMKHGWDRDDSDADTDVDEDDQKAVLDSLLGDKNRKAEKIAQLDGIMPDPASLRVNRAGVDQVDPENLDGRAEADNPSDDDDKIMAEKKAAQEAFERSDPARKRADEETAAAEQRAKDYGIPADLKTGKDAGETDALGKGPRKDENGIPIGAEGDEFVANHGSRKKGDKPERRKKKKKDKKGKKAKDGETEDGQDNPDSTEQEGGDGKVDAAVDEVDVDDPKEKKRRKKEEKKRKKQQQPEGDAAGDEAADSGRVRDNVKETIVETVVDAARDVASPDGAHESGEAQKDPTGADKEAQRDPEPEPSEENFEDVPLTSATPDDDKSRRKDDVERGDEADSNRFGHEGREDPQAPLGRRERQERKDKHNDGSKDSVIDPESGETKQSRGILAKASALARKIAHIARRSPLFSLLTLAAVLIWVGGARQLANLVILSTGSSAVDVAAKRGFDADLEITSSVATDLLNVKSLSTTGLFFVVNAFIFVSVLITGLMLSCAMSRADTTRERNPDAWWRHPVRSTKFAFAACLSLSKIFTPVLMGTRLHGPMTILRRATWRTYVRFGMFLLQIGIVMLLIRQSMSVVYILGTGASTSYSDMPDVAASSTAIASALEGVSPTTAFAALALILGVTMPALALGLYALLHPRPSRSQARKNGLRSRLKGNKTIAKLLRLIGAVVITVTFVGIMYFFGEIAAYATSADTATQPSSTNLLAANVILLIFVPPLGWALMTFWECLKALKGPGGGGDSGWGCAGIGCASD